MDLQDLIEMLKPRTRLLRGLVLGVLVAFGLAVSYVYGGGMELLGNAEFVSIDGYAFTIAFLVGSLIPVGYWLYFRDVSEALAIFLGIAWALLFGLEDLFVYLVSAEYSVPQVLPWLSDSPVGMTAALIGFDEVTRTALYAVVLLTGLLLVFFVKTLDSIEEKVLGVKV